MVLSDSEPHDRIQDDVAGPHAWLNWVAARAGQPARELSSTNESPAVRPLWQEYALYSDALIAGELELGPYRLVMTMPNRRARVGHASIPVVLRATDHLLDPDFASPPPEEHQDSAYVGGDEGAEIAALLALALGCRVRSGGVIRQRFSGRDPAGEPTETLHVPPVLVGPYNASMLPKIAGEATLQDARELLETYAALPGHVAAAVVRAAAQYADALWFADADARVAWIKLVGALETGANAWDGYRKESKVERLRRHRPDIIDAMEGCPPEAIERVAGRLAQSLKPTDKYRQFTETFAPDPPAERPPEGHRFDWDALPDALLTIYDLRSRDLHDGIAFPWALRHPPIEQVPGDVPPEAFPALGAWAEGGYWPASRMPMYLHVFAYVARGALTAWWRTLTPSA